MTTQIIDRLAWVSLGLVLGALLTGMAIASAVLEYDRSMQMFEALRRRYGTPKKAAE